MRDRSCREARRDLVEVDPITCGESDGDRTRRNGLDGALTGSVDSLRDLRPVREISADDDVVCEVCGGVPITDLRRERPDVNGCGGA